MLIEYCNLIEQYGINQKTENLDLKSVTGRKTKEIKMPIVTLPGGEVRDEIRQPLYDTVDLKNTTLPGVYNFFSSVVNSAGVPKSIASKRLSDPVCPV